MPPPGYRVQGSGTACTLRPAPCTLHPAPWLGNKLREVIGGWADDLQSRARGRVGEGEGGGVKQGTIRLIGSLRAVQPVAKDRMAGGKEVDSNLVRSSGD